MAWFLSPSGWPTFADSDEEQADLEARGYGTLADDQVQAAIDAFNAVSPPVVTPPGFALAVDVAAALALKANASSLPGKLSIADIPNAGTPGGAALRAAFGSAAREGADFAARAAANADHAAAFARIQRLFLGPPAGLYLARSGNDYTFLLGLGSSRYAAWLLPRQAQSLNGVTYTVNSLNGAAIQIPMVSVDDTAATFGGSGTWTNQPMNTAADPGYKAIPLTVTATAGNATINYTGGPLTAADTGRRVLIPGAGAGGADLNTSIGSITGTTFAVGTAPSVALTNAPATLLTSYRYNPTAGATATWATPASATAVAVGTLTTAGASMFTAYNLSAGFASAWEYALECRPASGSTWTFIGQTAHQYEDQQSLTIYLEDVATTPADGTITACNSAQIVRTTKLYHPDLGAALASPVLGTASVVYRLDRNGLTVTPTITWAVDTVVRTAYVMMPLVSAAGVLAKMDRVALEASAAVFTMTGSNARSGFTRSASAWMWDSTGKVGACMYVPDHWGFTNGYASGVQGSQVEDRGGVSPTTKFYFPWAGVNSDQTFKAGTSKSYTARYMLAFFAGGADAALAAA